MLELVIKPEDGGFTWLDVVEPSSAELEQVASTYRLHKTSVLDCLQPDHLPKNEFIEGLQFLILRAYDDEARSQADEVNSMTRKLAIFFGEKFIVTIHRRDQIYIRDVRETWRNKEITENARFHVLNDLLRGAINSFASPLKKYEDEADAIEEALFTNVQQEPALVDGFYLRRKATVIRNMLKSAYDIVAKVQQVPDVSKPFYQDLREQAEGLYSRSTQLADEISELIHLQISLVSHRTNESSHKINEVMRVLTLFSAFFLPLNFLASIYGMNFENMPELKTAHGYHVVLGVMGAIAASIYSWFLLKGWLKWPWSSSKSAS